MGVESGRVCSSVIPLFHLAECLLSVSMLQMVQFPFLRQNNILLYVYSTLSLSAHLPVKI